MLHRDISYPKTEKEEKSQTVLLKKQCIKEYFDALESLGVDKE